MPISMLWIDIGLLDRIWILRYIINSAQQGVAVKQGVRWKFFNVSPMGEGLGGFTPWAIEKMGRRLEDEIQKRREGMVL